MINAYIQGSYLRLDGKTAGVKGESRMKTLRLHLSPEWLELTKKVLFMDAKGQNPVSILLSSEVSSYVAGTELVFDVPIPGEALAEEGECTFIVSGTAEDKQGYSVQGNLKVLPNDFYGVEPGNASTPTPTEMEQLQGYMDDILQQAGESTREAVTESKNAQAAAERAEREAAISEHNAAVWVNGGNLEPHEGEFLLQTGVDGAAFYAGKAEEYAGNAERAKTTAKEQAAYAEDMAMRAHEGNEFAQRIVNEAIVSVDVASQNVVRHAEAAAMHAEIAYNSGEAAKVSAKEAAAARDAALAAESGVAADAEAARKAAAGAQSAQVNAENAASMAEGYTSHPPVPREDGRYWMLWNGEKYVETHYSLYGDMWTASAVYEETKDGRFGINVWIYKNGELSTELHYVRVQRLVNGFWSDDYANLQDGTFYIELQSEQRYPARVLVFSPGGTYLYCVAAVQRDNITLPEGAVLSVNDQNPDKNGNVKLDVGVKTVNDQTPNENGNVNLDVGVKTVNGQNPSDNGNVNLDVGVKTVNDQTPNENGNVKLDVGVKTINGSAPDENGNIEIVIPEGGGGSEGGGGGSKWLMMDLPGVGTGAVAGEVVSPSVFGNGYTVDDIHVGDTVLSRVDGTIMQVDGIFKDFGVVGLSMPLGKLMGADFGAWSDLQAVISETVKSNGASGTVNSPLALEVGQHYIVEFDGMYYECDCVAWTYNNKQYGLVGNAALVNYSSDNKPDTGEPFCLMHDYYNSKTTIWTGAGLHSLGVYTGTLQKLNKKYLNNALHFGETEMVFCEETTVTVSDNHATLAEKLEFVAGETYIVTWEGVRYKCVAVNASYQGIPVVGVGNMGFIGGANNGMPFAIGYAAAAGATMAVAPVDGNYTFSIVRMAIQKMENKYLDLAWLPTINYEWENLVSNEEATGAALSAYDFTKAATARSVQVLLNPNSLQNLSIHICKPLSLLDGYGFALGNLGLLGDDYPGTGEPFCLLFQNLSGRYGLAGIYSDIELESISISAEVAHYNTLPDAFLPSSADGEFSLTGNDIEEDINVLSNIAAACRKSGAAKCVYKGYHYTVLDAGGDLEGYKLLLFRVMGALIGQPSYEMYVLHYTMYDVKLMPYLTEKALYLDSSTINSTKTFKITVDDNGTLSVAYAYDHE